MGSGHIAVPADQRRYPQEAYRARFAGHWLVARALIDGEITLRTFDTITPMPPQVQDLVKKVEFRITPFEQFPAYWPSRVHVTDTKGLEATFSVEGAPLSMNADNVELLLTKCRHNLTYGGVSPGVADELLALSTKPSATIRDFWNLF